jgi:hypothetical protein
MANEEKPAKIQTAYCPKCRARYTYETDRCAACDVELTHTQPRDEPIFKPKVDIPFLLFAVLFIAFYRQLPGEAQSFGLIFLVVGAAALVAFRAIGQAEWLGRR